jgi:uncharacterized protein
MDDKIRILSISDIHGSVELVQKAEKILKQVDIVLISGDITHFGNAKDAAKVIDEIKKYNKNIYAVTGNCDYPEVNEYLTKEKINLTGKVTDISGIKLLGFNGSLTTPSNTPNENSENYYNNSIEDYGRIYPKEGPVIIISHQPPYGTCDAIGDMHVGCKSLAEFIEKYQPLACFCGHVHEADGVDQIGNTYIMNPGRFSGGGAILAEVHIEEKDASLTFVELFG